MSIFFLAMQNRSGSTWLGHMLTSTGAVGDVGEHVHAMEPDLAAGWQRIAGLDLGIKLNLDQAQRMFRVAGDELLAAPWIWLRRRDSWAVAISQLTAEASGVWIDPNRPGVIVRRQPVELTEEQVVFRYRQVRDADEQWLAWFRQQEISPLTVWYEDLLEKPRELVYLILGYLGVYYTGDVTLNLTRVQRTAEDVRLALRLREKYGP